MTDSVWRRLLLRWRGEDSPGPRREGLLGYLKDDFVVPLALVSGLICTLGIIPYTTHLSRQIFECPSWAIGCEVYTDNVGTIQGAVTLVYTIGLMCIAYADWALAEVSLWPLLMGQTFTCRQIDRFLAVSRGSIPAIPLALGAVKRWRTWWIILCAVLTTLTSLSAGPVVGYIFDQSFLPTTYRGELVVGGGSNTLFHQQYPPIYTDIAASGFYSDWFSGYKITEPMPTYRYWLIDRLLLDGRGNFTADAVMIQKNVSCKPFHLKQIRGPISQPGNQLYFHTLLSNVTDYDNPNGVGSANVVVYNSRLLAVWVHDVHFVSANRTRASLAFALPGGKIEDSSTTFLNVTGKIARHANITAVVCDIDVELVDAALTVGDGGSAGSSLPTLSTINSLRSGNRANSSEPPTHKQLALLFAIAPTAIGNSHAGMQPNFIPLQNSVVDGTLIPAGNLGLAGIAQWDYVIQRDQILNLIERSISAVSLSMSLKSRRTRVTMDSTTYAHRMRPARNAILAIPVVILLLIWLILALMTWLLHRRSNLRTIRLCETFELLDTWRNGLMPQDDAADLEAVKLVYQPAKEGMTGPEAEALQREINSRVDVCARKPGSKEIGEGANTRSGDQITSLSTDCESPSGSETEAHRNLEEAPTVQTDEHVSG